MRRRKPEHHLPKIGGPSSPRGFTPEHSPWTVEGRIEAIGMMGRALKNSSPRQDRYFRTLVVITVAALVALALVSWLISQLAN